MGQAVLSVVRFIPSCLRLVWAEVGCGSAWLSYKTSWMHRTATCSVQPEV